MNDRITIPDDIKLTLIDSLLFVRAAIAPLADDSFTADIAVGEIDKALAWLDGGSQSGWRADLDNLWPTVPNNLEGVDLFDEFPIVGI